MKADTNTNNIQAHNWEKTEMTFAAYAARQHVPLGGTFELTPRCSLNCKMCYVRLDKPQMNQIGRELTANEWIRIAHEALEAGTLNLLITGGEPLIREDFAEIYTALSGMGFIIKLNTNATLITPEIVKLFSRYPPTATCVTLYGASPDTYEKICGDANGFDKTIRGLELISKIPTELEVRTTFIRDNMNELDEIRTIANRYTNRYGINTDVFKPIRGAVSDVETCRMTPGQITDIVNSNFRYYNDLNHVDEIDIFQNTIEENTSKKDFGFKLPPTVLNCLASKATYWITWDGKMLPCGCFSSPYTLPLEEGFLPAWKRLPDLLEIIPRPSECLKCEVADGICPNCPAKLQAETGRFDGISQYICSIAKERQNNM